MARQARLPGTEDAAIVELEQAADDYMEVRDERLKYLKEEVKNKETILGILKANGKREYRRGDYIIKIRTVKEKLLVKRKSERKRKLAA
jgi:hypothetical protein